MESEFHENLKGNFYLYSRDSNNTSVKGPYKNLQDPSQLY
jgi:hypothetical protein